jgi:hypothetical protein
MACMGKKRNAYTAFVGKPDGKRDCFEYLSIDGSIIIEEILKIGCEDVDWINLAQDRDE